MTYRAKTLRYSKKYWEHFVRPNQRQIINVEMVQKGEKGNCDFSWSSEESLWANGINANAKISFSELIPKYFSWRTSDDIRQFLFPLCCFKLRVKQTWIENLSKDNKDDAAILALVLSKNSNLGVVLYNLYWPLNSELAPQNKSFQTKRIFWGNRNCNSAKLWWAWSSWYW